MENHLKRLKPSATNFKEKTFPSRKKTLKLMLRIFPYVLKLLWWSLNFLRHCKDA